MNPEKLAKLQASVRIGGKGTPRRKVKKVHHTAGDDKKLQATLKKLNCQPVPGIEEVNMFKNDTTILNFAAPKVQAAVGSNTFVIQGVAEVKNLTELLPSVMGQLDPNTVSSIRAHGAAASAAPADDDDVPDLVDTDNFDQTD
ncbi:NAC domain-containing protein [Entophlyctis helioformis]|nr:NAC domain-containing protein [Entophlyctis helioformis]